MRGRTTGPITKAEAVLTARDRSGTATPDLWLDAKVDKVRDGAQVVRERLVVAHAVLETRRRG